MLKKLMFSIIVLMCTTGITFAQDITADTESAVESTINVGDFLKVIPALKQGVAFSFRDSKFNYIATLDVLNYKGFNLEAGYAGAVKGTQDKLIVLATYDLWDAKKAGITIPILDLIKFRPGLYMGVGRITIDNSSGREKNNRFDVGASVTLMDVKF